MTTSPDLEPALSRDGADFIPDLFSMGLVTPLLAFFP